MILLISGSFFYLNYEENNTYIIKTLELKGSVKEGDTLCIIEAMKLFNEIEPEVSGKIVKVLVDDASPIEFDQPLFLVDPS